MWETALKRVLSRAHLRLADRSDACEGPGGSRTEHMQQESGYVGGVPKMATGAEAFLEEEDTLAAGRPHCRTRASCWKRLERENVHASVALADVWMVLERGLLLDRLKRARRRDPRRKDGAGAGVRAFVRCSRGIAGPHLLLAAHPQLTGSSWNTF